MRTIRLLGAKLREPKAFVPACLAVATVIAGSYGLIRWSAAAGPATADTHKSRKFDTTRLSEAEAALIARLGFADSSYGRTAESAEVTRQRPEVAAAASALATRMSDAEREPASPPATASAPTASAPRAAAAAEAATVQVAYEKVETQTVAAAGPGSKVASLLPASADVPAPAVPAERAAGMVTPAIHIDLQRRRGGIRAVMPIELDVASTINSRVLIGRVPQGVSFSRGQPAGLGMWQMRVAEFSITQIVVDAAAPETFHLTFMLLNTEGMVVNGIDVGFRQTGTLPPPATVEAAPPATPPAAAVAPLKRAPARTGAVAPQGRGGKRAYADHHLDRKVKSSKLISVPKPSALAPQPQPIQVAAQPAPLWSNVKPWAPVQVLGWPQ